MRWPPFLVQLRDAKDYFVAAFFLAALLLQGRARMSPSGWRRDPDEPLLWNRFH